MEEQLCQGSLVTCEENRLEKEGAARHDILPVDVAGGDLGTDTLSLLPPRDELLPGDYPKADAEIEEHERHEAKAAAKLQKA